MTERKKSIYNYNEKVDVMVKALDSGIIVGKFELQSR